MTSPRSSKPTNVIFDNFHECSETIPYIDSVSSQTRSDINFNRDSSNIVSPTYMPEPQSTMSATSFRTVKTGFTSVNSDRDRMAVVEDHCRICLDTEGTLQKPCKCCGTMGSVHHDCLVQWLKMSGRDTCELCSMKYRYKVKIKPICQWARPNSTGRRQTVKIFCQAVLAIFSMAYACHMTFVIGGSVKKWSEIGSAVRTKKRHHDAYETKYDRNAQRWRDARVSEGCIRNLICGRLNKLISKKAQYSSFLADLAEEKVTDREMRRYIFRRIRFGPSRFLTKHLRLNHEFTDCNSSEADPDCARGLSYLAERWAAMKSSQKAVDLTSAQLSALGRKLMAHGFELFFATVVLLVTIYFGLVCLSGVLMWIKNGFTQWISKNSTMKVSDFQDIEAVPNISSTDAKD